MKKKMNEKKKKKIKNHLFQNKSVRCLATLQMALGPLQLELHKLQDGVLLLFIHKLLDGLAETFLRQKTEFLMLRIGTNA